VGYVPNNVVPKEFMAVALDLRDDLNGRQAIFYVLLGIIRLF
jgi:hypothetical protein